MASSTVAICIPSHNCGPYLRLAIESALAQTTPAAEVIVSDDHSTDGSVNVLSRYKNDSRVRVIIQPERLSLGEHYRALLAECTADYVAFLSADDALLPNFTAETIRATGPTVTFVVAAAIETDGELRPRRTRGTSRRSDFSPPNGFRYFTTGNFYTVSTSLMLRRELEVIPILPRDLDLVTDWYWALMLSRQGDVAFTSKPVGLYRVHTSNAGHGSSRWHATSLDMRRWLASQLLDEERKQLLDAAEEGDAMPPSRRTIITASSRDFANRLNAFRYLRQAAATSRLVRPSS